METIFEILRARSDDEGWTYASSDDVRDWANLCALSIPDFLDAMGANIARGYHSSLYSYEFCDSLVNDLDDILIELVLKNEDFEWPALFQEVYEAFDAGEFHRTKDKSDNPVAENTDPAIADIIAKIGTAAPQSR